ncbi:MAG: SCO family protein [Chloroflexota bacterium]|jgi:protein SCO1/2
MTSTSEAPDIRQVSARRRRLIVLAIGGVLVGLLAGWLTIQFVTGNWRLGPYKYRGVVLPAPESVSDFSLTAHDGETARLSDFRGQIAVLYFGYTYCPDVCPTTLATLANALDDLKAADRDQVQVLMVTVDPDRDSPGVLADYLAHFDPTFIGLTGTAGELAQAAEALGIYYEKGEGSVASGYLVDHTATVSVLDKEGRLRLLFPFGTPAEDIAADLQHLIRES